MRSSLVLMLVVTGCGGGDGSSADLAAAGNDAAIPHHDAAAAADLNAASKDLSTAPADASTPPDGALSWKDRCFAGLGQGVVGPDYDQFNPKYATTHCSGTNAQDITGVEKVVFLGDSITVGTPPTATADFYRSLLAQTLATKFNLQPPDNVWESPNFFTGMSVTQSSGDFESCSKYGARLDDLHGMGGADQIAQCFADVEPKRTLVVMTFGGNDFASYAKQGMGGTDANTLLAQVDDAIARLASALDYLQDPMHFPNGTFVVMANVYEFTDGTGDEMSCPVAGIAGFNSMWPDGVTIFDHLNEQIVKTAVDKNVDVVFMEENFCGHGFKHDDANAPCYRGPNTPLWFDPNTCTHPNTAGHAALAGFFDDVVNE
jgi:lysophospholipase L1-like esterase